MTISARTRRVTLLAILACSGCAANPDGNEIGSEQQGLIAGWFTAGWGTTSDANGLDLKIPSGWSCILNGVTGNLVDGNVIEYQDLPAKAEIANGRLFGSGGADTNWYDQRVWANAPVFAGATCIPYLPIATGTWISNPDHVPSPPVWLTSLGGSNRQCFLTGLESTETSSWDSSSTYAQVYKATTTDATHPVTGWYVQSNSSVNPGGHVAAACYDFPVGTGFWWAQFGGPNTFQTTWGTAVKACGLTYLQGSFNANDFGNGVHLNAPTDASGNWSLTVTSADKVGGAVCAL